MPSTNMSQVREAVGKSFDKIGKHNGSAALPASDNHHPLVHEYYIASVLEALAKKRRENARGELDAAGITDGVGACKPGDTRTLYENEHIALSVKKNRPASRFDQTKLRVELLKVMTEDKANELVKKCTVSNAPATSLICSTK